MTPRAFLSFFKTKTGAFTLFSALLTVGYVLVRGVGTRPSTDSPPVRKASLSNRAKPQVVETVIRDMTPFQPPKETPKAGQVPPEPVPPRGHGQGEVPPISIVTPTEKEVIEAPIGSQSAPFGRLVPCELVVTVDSSSIETPIIGLVTGDVWHQGRRIIPAGTEVHGRARVDRTRERIAAQGQWTFVWQTGEELNLNGVALDREHDSEGGAWGITDGSAGLRGQLLKSDELAEIKLFAATFLSGAASGFNDRESTAFGNQLAGTVKNAQIAGMQQVLNGYAKQIYESIQREGFFVRVPAGKQFYVYVTQTIDKAKAMQGASSARALSVPVVPVPRNTGLQVRSTPRESAPQEFLFDADSTRLIPVDPGTESPEQRPLNSP